MITPMYCPCCGSGSSILPEKCEVHVDTPDTVMVTAECGNCDVKLQLIVNRMPVFFHAPPDQPDYLD